MLLFLVGDSHFFWVVALMVIGEVFFKRIGVLMRVWSSIFLGIEMSGIVEKVLF